MTQQWLEPHILDFHERLNQVLLVTGDKRMEEAKLKDRERQEAHEELVEQLRYRMERLVGEGGGISGLPNNWKGLSSDIISRMLDEVERVYRRLLHKKIVELGAWASTESNLSIDRLEQDLKNLRNC